MIPVTLKLLAGLVQLHGTEPTILSDNKGIDDLLGPVREQLKGNETPPVVLAAYPKTTYGRTHMENLYKRVIYTRSYEKWVGIQSQSRPTPGPGVSGPPRVSGGGGHRR